jgi:5'-methylthioadenosine phosphorylase
MVEYVSFLSRILMKEKKTSIAVILGSAFDQRPDWLEIETRKFNTPYGEATLYLLEGSDPPAYVLFRHGLPHRYLPHQIPYRAHTWALKEVNCKALVVTSSDGILTEDLPIFQPLLIADLIMLDNRLPDGSTCTMFTEPSREHAHLMISGGLFSQPLGDQIKTLARENDWPIAGEVIFGFVGGPRNKTPAENRIWPKLGATANSMSVGPEVVLANEMAIPTAGLVVGHKYSVPGLESGTSNLSLAKSFEHSREAFARLVQAFLRNGQPVAFENVLYNYHDQMENNP